MVQDAVAPSTDDDEIRVLLERQARELFRDASADAA
jgi:hypothetical protein